MASAFFIGSAFASESRRPPVPRSARSPRICHSPALQSHVESINAMSPWAPGLPPDSAAAMAAAIGAALAGHPAFIASAASCSRLNAPLTAPGLKRATPPLVSVLGGLALAGTPTRPLSPWYVGFGRFFCWMSSLTGFPTFGCLSRMALRAFFFDDVSATVRGCEALGALATSAAAVVAVATTSPPTNHTVALRVQSMRNRGRRGSPVSAWSGPPATSSPSPRLASASKGRSVPATTAPILKCFPIQSPAVNPAGR